MSKSAFPDVAPPDHQTQSRGLHQKVKQRIQQQHVPDDVNKKGCLSQTDQKL
jgi:hypothetical protein